MTNQVVVKKNSKNVTIIIHKRGIWDDFIAENVFIPKDSSGFDRLIEEALFLKRVVSDSQYVTTQRLIAKNKEKWDVRRVTDSYCTFPLQ